MEGSAKIPLLLADILDNFFKFISSKELYKLRLTTKVWNDCAKRGLKKRYNVAIILGDNLTHNEEFLQHIVDHPDGFCPPAIILRNYELVDELEHSVPSIPENELEENLASKQLETSPEGYFHSGHEIIVEICGILGTRGVIKRLEIDFRKESFQTFNYGYLLKILGNLSSSLEILEFHGHCQLPTEMISIPGEQYELIQAEFNDKTPLQKLKRVQYKDENDSDFLQEDGLHEWFSLILTGASSIKEFDFACEKLFIFLEIGRLSQIKCENISFSSVQQLDTILKTGHLNLNFKTLLIWDFTLDLESKTKVERGLKCLGKTLRYLDLNMDMQEGVFFQILEMPELTHLDFAVIGSRCGLQARFARSMPKLKILQFHNSSGQEVINDWDWEVILSRSENMQDGMIVPCNSLKQLMMGGLPLVDPECCKYLGELFPNVDKLHLRSPSGNFLQVIWTNWEERLKTLELRFDVEMDIDQILFGLEMDWKNGIERDERQWWRGIRPPQPANANLICLKDLETLELTGNCNMTDFSVYFGLMRVKRLADFRFSPDGESRLTQEAMSHLKVCRIRFRDSYLA